jgi:hypothetical protein
VVLCAAGFAVFDIRVDAGEEDRLVGTCGEHIEGARRVVGDLELGYFLYCRAREGVGGQLVWDFSLTGAAAAADVEVGSDWVEG